MNGYIVKSCATSTLNPINLMHRLTAITGAWYSIVEGDACSLSKNLINLGGTPLNNKSSELAGIMVRSEVKASLVPQIPLLFLCYCKLCCFILEKRGLLY